MIDASRNLAQPLTPLRPPPQKMPSYGENDYWNDRYTNAETEHFEWYCPFLDLETKVRPDADAAEEQLTWSSKMADPSGRAECTGENPGDRLRELQ